MDLCELFGVCCVCYGFYGFVVICGVFVVEIVFIFVGDLFCDLIIDCFFVCSYIL